MIYHSFRDLQLSALGLGCMRLPKTEDGGIDEAAVGTMVDYALSNGINYFDTAWFYHGGRSEPVIGKVLGRYPRESYHLATKFPGIEQKNFDHIEEIFEEQLRRTGAGYFDFYLLHNVNGGDIDDYLDTEKYGLLPYLKRQRDTGRIRHLGFSAHAPVDIMARFLDACGEDMEFCQIQLNWLDWNLQDAKDKVKLLNERGLPIWVMEPLRGGKLAALSEADTARLHALRPGETVPGWGFRFLQSVPGVTMVLSGMSDLAQVQGNVATFQIEQPASAAERETLFDIAWGLTGGVPCTGCRYCTEYCPQGLPIPDLLRIYNEFVFTGDDFMAGVNLYALTEEQQPDHCIACRSCEAACPQGIKISEALADFRTKLKK